MIFCGTFSPKKNGEGSRYAVPSLSPKKTGKEEFHLFKPYGITYFAIISKSHISIHTWPEDKIVAVDIFSCENINSKLNVRSIVQEENLIRQKDLLILKELFSISSPKAIVFLHSYFVASIISHKIIPGIRLFLRSEPSSPKHCEKNTPDLAKFCES